jgi:hypothetical protein
LRRAGEPELVLIVLFRWLTFRVMFGAGLIKVRGDACWTDLTCLFYHYETQPNPNLLSPYLHRMPAFVHRAGVLLNHLVELVAPFGVFGPRRIRYLAGGLIVLFQLLLIASGNLSFLNWLTIAIALACFDDAAFSKLSALLRLDRLRRPGERPARAEPSSALVPAPSRARRAVVYGLAVVIAALSFNPIVNLLSPRQAMNASFEPFKLVNTYGAFGSVGQVRDEVILEGTSAEELGPDTRWLEFGFPCKPGDPARLPCQISPYHYRLDWQMWFLAMGPIQRDPWAIHLIYKLLQGDRTIDPLIQNPFSDRPPRFVRARLYRYRFAKSSEPGVWVRSYLTEYVRPLARDDPELLDYLRRHGLLE